MVVTCDLYSLVFFSQCTVKVDTAIIGKKEETMSCVSARIF
jgi:hypothetical protein